MAELINKLYGGLKKSSNKVIKSIFYLDGGIRLRNYSGSTTENFKCELCGKSTGSFESYRYENGLEIQVPVCNQCSECSTEKFWESMKSNMKARLKQIRCDIHVEKEISR